MNAAPTAPHAVRLPKLCGADIEFGNAVIGTDWTTSNGAGAGLALINEIARAPVNLALCPRYGVQWRGSAGWQGANVNDGGGPGSIVSSWERVWLASTGGCWYLDHEHAEGCLPETLDARDHLAGWHVLRHQAEGALRRINTRLRERGRRLVILANNSDGQGNSYGGHIDLLVSRQAFDRLFDRRLHYLLFLAAHQVSSIIYTGQGKVGAENGADPCAYQIAQRADFMEVLVGPQTTQRRTVVNSRDEPLCGRVYRPHAAKRDAPCDRAARLHVIFYDTTLCDRASLLKVGALQIVLAMIEAGAIDVRLLLDDPLDALHAWSHDPELRTAQPLASGTRRTALEHQIGMLECARAFVDAGGCENVVPGAAALVELWDDTLRKFERRDLDSLVPAIDWLLKRALLERTLDDAPGLDWASPEIKHLDHIYSSLDDDGLFAAVAAAGAVERLVDPARVQYLAAHPPEHTRAWTRALLLRRALEEGATVTDVDWDRITLRVEPDGLVREHSLDMPDPLGPARDAVAPVAGRPLDELLEILGATTSEWRRYIPYNAPPPPPLPHRPPPPAPIPLHPPPTPRGAPPRGDSRGGARRKDRN